MPAVLTPLDLFELEKHHLAEVVDRSSFENGNHYTVYVINRHFNLCHDDSDQVFPRRMNDHNEWVLTGPALQKKSLEKSLN